MHRLFRSKPLSMAARNIQLGEPEKRFIASLPRREYGSGAPVFHEGDPGTELMLVVRGRVQLTRRTAAGEDLALGLVGVGGVIGELAALTDAPRTATARAVGDVRVAVLERRALLEAMATRDPVARALLRACAQVVVHRLRRTRDLVSALRAEREGASPEQVDQLLMRAVTREEGLLIDYLHQWMPAE